MISIFRVVYDEDNSFFESVVEQMEQPTPENSLLLLYILNSLTSEFDDLFIELKHKMKVFVIFIEVEDHFVGKYQRFRNFLGLLFKHKPK